MNLKIWQTQDQNRTTFFKILNHFLDTIVISRNPRSADRNGSLGPRGPIFRSTEEEFSTVGNWIEKKLFLKLSHSSSPTTQSDASSIFATNCLSGFGDIFFHHCNTFNAYWIVLLVLILRQLTCIIKIFLYDPKQIVL